MRAAPPRILITTDAVGGVWNYALDLAAGLGALGCEVALALLGPGADEGKRSAVRRLSHVELVETGLALDWLAEDPAQVEQAGRRIAELAGDWGADIAQLNMPALAATGRFAVPVVAVAHSCVATWWEAVVGGPLPEDFVWRTELVRAGFHRAAAVAAPSRAFAEATMRTYGLPRLPTVVHNGRPARRLPRAGLHDFVFAAGRLWDRAKNLEMLDRAAARLCIPVKAAGPTSGPHGARIELSNIKALGEVSQSTIAGCLSSRPIFVSVARYEPFGLAVLEAAQAGCALLLSDIPTFRELWGEAALYIDPDDADALVEAVDQVCGDVSLRLAMGDAARQRARRYTPELMAGAMAAIYRSVAARPLPLLDHAQVAA